MVAALHEANSRIRSQHNALGHACNIIGSIIAIHGCKAPAQISNQFPQYWDERSCDVISLTRLRRHDLFFDRASARTAHGPSAVLVPSFTVQMLAASSCRAVLESVP